MEDGRKRIVDSTSRVHDTKAQAACVFVYSQAWGILSGRIGVTALTVESCSRRQIGVIRCDKIATVAGCREYLVR